MARKLEEIVEGNWKSMTMAMSAEDWASLRDDEIRVVCDGSHVVCAVWGGKDDDEVKAAGLIAAAPDLLAQLKHARAMLLDAYSVFGEDRLKDIDAAIAKAEGRTETV